MPILEHAFETALATLLDVAPIVALLVAFQVLVIRRPPPHLRRIVVGCGCVLAGLVLFLMGLEKALFPLGEAMATQLTARDLVGATAGGGADWRSFVWVYVFAAAIGFATTLAEPSLIAVGMKAEEVSGGAVHGWGLRIAVAVGVALGVALGAFRIVTGTPLAYYIMAGYAIVIVQTVFAPRTIVALAYDSGGGHHLDRDGAGRRRAGARPRRRDPGPQPVDRRVRPDRVRKRVSHYFGVGVCHAVGGVPPLAPYP